MKNLLYQILVRLLLKTKAPYVRAVDFGKITYIISVEEYKPVDDIIKTAKEKGVLDAMSQQSKRHDV